jgi:outer membrane protein
MMRKAVAILILTSFAVSVAAIPIFAQDVKFGYIDSIKIFAEHSSTQDAERVYKKEVETWKAQAASMEQEIVKLQDELRAQSLLLSEEKQKEKKLELDKKLEDYQRFMADTFGEDGLAARRNKELTQPIVDKINTILQKLGEEEGYTIIFDIANANIVYAKKALDLTDRVLEELNTTGQ